MPHRVNQRAYQRGAGVVFALIMLSACQTASKIDSTDLERGWLNDAAAFAQPRLEFEQIPRWRFSAKVGLTTPELKEQASLVWEFADQANSVRMFGPLGAGAIRLEFDDYGVQLSDNKGVLHRGHNAEALLTDIIGWPIPMDALSYWLFALPTPDSTFRYRLDADDNLSELQQLGWTIKYSGYREYQGSDRPLARKLIATKLVDDGLSVTVKLITRNWERS